MIYLLTLLFIFGVSKAGLLRPFMLSRTKAGDYATSDHATLRDFFLSLLPRSELEIHWFVMCLIGNIVAIRGFHFSSLQRVRLDEPLSLLPYIYFALVCLQALALIWLILRCDLFLRTQMAVISLALILQCVMAYESSHGFSMRMISLDIVATFFWFLVFLFSSWRFYTPFFPLFTSRRMRPKAFPPRAPGRYRLLLIEPSTGSDHSPYSVRHGMYPSTVPMVAATAPANWDVMILDEVHSEIDFDLDVDVVGITTMAAYSASAKRIALRFREKGRAVIFGGSDVAQNADSYSGHGDSVLVGEAFGYFPKVLEDWRQGKLARKYVNSVSHDLVGLPLPRNDLLPLRRYMNVHNILISTSCPFACEFCSYAKDRMPRLRPPEEVVAAVKNTPSKYFYFEAPELLIYKPYLRRLEVALSRLNIHWATCASLKSCSDASNLTSAHRAGMRYVMLGVETFNQDALAFVNKRINTVSTYESILKAIDKAGISTQINLIFGLPQDDIKDFQRGLEILNRGRASTVSHSPLTAYSKDDAFEKKLQASGGTQVRAFEELNAAEGLTYTLYRPKKYTDSEFDRYTEEFMLSFHSFRSIFRRLFLRSYRNFPNFFPDLIENLCRKFQRRSYLGLAFSPLDHMDHIFYLPRGEARRLAISLETECSTTLHSVHDEADLITAISPAISPAISNES